ncbi:hypothetical protein NECAME_00591 [Necator americanus]|uniref:MAM domain-containing protein n=1 Tax=Necator americanus TaxID=51031 RepID=W2SZK4_NECAM|nr:hypothetical protein NECAME_00591 [Necator americanus]ETN75180.1 hypothetical protein NECAME_00591 [Necator americanus]
MVSTICDLECYDFDSFLTKPCRWRNEKNTCDADGDEIDFIRMKGSWGESEGDTIFGTSDRADGYFLIAGVQQKLPPMYSAVLVSDPIQCQEGDGVVKMRFWASPGVKIRICTRAPSMGKRYIWCSDPIKRNNTKLAKVIIPGTIWYTFEIVVEAYNFALDAFGKQGGAAIIDDITYNSSAIYECKMIPHYDPPVKLPKKTCPAVRCDFERGSCLNKLESTGWKISEDPIGPRSTGIRSQLEGSYAYAVGPGTSTLSLGPFEFSRTFAIDFCYYAASYGSKLAVFLIEFSAEGLRNEYSYVGLDQIDVYDPIQGGSACEKKTKETTIPLQLQ